MSSSNTIIIEYVNWRGQYCERAIRPIQFFFGENTWHPEPQWMCEAIDLDDNLVKTFALNGIKSWRQV